MADNDFVIENVNYFKLKISLGFSLDLIDKHSSNESCQNLRGAVQIAGIIGSTRFGNNKKTVERPYLHIRRC